MCAGSGGGKLGGGYCVAANDMKVSRTGAAKDDSFLVLIRANVCGVCVWVCGCVCVCVCVWVGGWVEGWVVGFVVGFVG